MGFRVPPAADVVYLYDGSLPGFYSCVHESVYAGEVPAAIGTPEMLPPSLFEQKVIETDREKAVKVRAAIPKKIAPQALIVTQRTFLSCLPERELAILRFLLLGFQEGGKTLGMFGHPDVKPVLAAVNSMGMEVNHLEGFVRFSDYDGVLAATISPKNFVLPYLAGHFAARFSEERFLIFDRTHKAALIYENGKKQIVPMEGIEFPEADEKEKRYRALWKQFYRTVSIEGRENPKCRMRMMPKRFWEDMTEMKEYL